MNYINNNLAFDALKATESAAIAAHTLLGKGQEKEADRLAVEAMRQSFNGLSINGKIVIGEGERDQAPMLYIGEMVGMRRDNDPIVDIAVDPLEGTSLLANAENNALSVMAIANEGGLLHAPDIYMEKIITGVSSPEQLVDLDNSPKSNLQNIAKAKKCSVDDLVVMVLDRPRHQELIAKIREAGAKVRLLQDGDIAPAILGSMPDSGVDAYIGIGGAPEGVLAAAALNALGGQMCGRLVFANDEEKRYAQKLGISDLNKQYILSDLVKGDSIFIATGVTDGFFLQGVKYLPNNQVCLESLILQSLSSEDDVKQHNHPQKIMRKISNIYTKERDFEFVLPTCLL